MASLELRNVSKQVAKTMLLDTINVSIAKGEFMVVVGPSGCGKSTLLRLIAGLDTVSSGSILINNQCVNNTPPAKRNMAMVFQQYALYPHMSVFQNMAYGLVMRGFKKEVISQKVMDTAKLLRLVPYLDRKPQDLSGGQKQRVAMGRAMVRSPAVFLFDEPLSNLDAQLRTEMRHEIKKIHQKFNTTSLYVTHDQTEAMTMAERILVLNKGCVEQVGKPQDLYQNPQTVFVAGFTGHYPVNFVEGIYNQSIASVETVVGTCYPMPLGMELLANKSAVVLAIRAEHIQVCAPNAPQAIALQIEFVDDMGADKLIQGRCIKNGKRLQVRLSSDKPLGEGHLHVELPTGHLHFFDKQTDKRIGA